MSNELQDVLTDVIGVVMPFKELVSHILIRRSKTTNNIEGSADSRDGSIAISFESIAHVAELEHGACFGNLHYLNNVLSAMNIKNSDSVEMTLGYGMTSDGKTTALRSMEVTDGKKLSIFYQATDPFISKLTKKRRVAIDDWPVVFEINKSFITDFLEAAKIQASAPSMGNQDDLFTLSFGKDDGLSLLFGEGGYQLTLTPDTEAELNDGYDNSNVQSLFSKSQFQSVCQLLNRIKQSRAGDGTAVASFGDKAMRIDIDTKFVYYSITLVAKKVL